jgi:hypothetical protein
VLETLGATTGGGADRTDDIDGPTFEATLTPSGPGVETVDVLSVHPKRQVLLRWRLVKNLARRWHTVAAGEATLVQATVPAGPDGTSVVLSVRLLLSTRDLDGRVLSLSFRRERASAPRGKDGRAR